MVAVERAPSERELGEVAGPDDDRVVLVRLVHEDVRTAARLCVFVGDVVDGLVATDVREVTARRLGDVDRLERNPEALREQLGVAPGALRGSEAGHGEDVDALPVESESVDYFGQRH